MLETISGRVNLRPLNRLLAGGYSSPPHTPNPSPTRAADQSSRWHPLHLYSAFTPALRRFITRSAMP